MKLRSLDLENYRKFRKATIEFPEGLVGILGMNGAGKSTIIESIAWALYGNEKTIVRTAKEDVKRIGAAPKEPCRVTLEFELEGENYQVMREMKGVNFTMKTQVQINNKIAAQSTRDATEFLEDRIGMDHKAFYTSVFAKQKELNALSGLRSHERKRLVLRMLNIDAVDYAIKNLRKDKNIKKTEIETFRKVLYDEDGVSKINLHKEELKTTKSDRNALAPELKKIRKRIGALEIELKAFKNTLEAYENARDEFNRLNNEVAKLNATIDGLKNDIATREKELVVLKHQESKLESLEGSEKEWQEVKLRKGQLDKLKQDYQKKLELKTELEKLHKDFGSRKDKIKRQETELAKYKDSETELKKLDINKEKTQRELQACQNEKTMISSKIDHKKVQLEELKVKLEKIEKLGPSSECPTCERPLEDHFDDLVGKFNQELVAGQDLLKGLKAGLVMQENQLAGFNKLKDAQDKRERHLQKERLKFAELKSALKSNQDELKGIESKLKDREKTLKQLESVDYSEREYKDIESKYKKLEKVHEEIIQLTGQIKKIPEVNEYLKKSHGDLKNADKARNKLEADLKKVVFDSEKYKTLKGDYESKLNQFNTSNLELKDVQNDIDKLIEKMASINTRLEELTELEVQVHEKEEEIKYLTGLDRVMNDFKTYLISRISPMLSEFASELFRKLTDGKYNEMVIDEDYNIYIYDEGTKYELSRFSGGEEDLANLCLRLAISQVIAERSGTSGLNFIILDEIFGSQDLSRKRNLMLALNELSNKFRQIFLITHIEDIKEYIGNVINVVENEQGISSIKLIG